MKIGIVCPYNIVKNGGVQEHVLATRAELIERGHEVKIITPKPRAHAADAPEGVIFFGVSTDFRTLSFADSTSQVSSTEDAEKIDAIFATERFDILHFHEPWPPLLSRQLLQRSSSVNIATFHAKISDAITTRSMMRVVGPYLKSVMRYLDVITAVSPSAAEYVSGMTDLPITIIPNGIDLKKYKIQHVDKAGQQQSVLFIGRLERRKGVKYLLQAFQLLSQDHPDLKLIIAGDGPDREKLELLAEDLKLKNIEFLGFISDDLKFELLAQADIFCSPALFGESFGIVLLEAMATGAVAVAGNNSGYVGVMDGIGALSIVNPTDVEEFARRLALLLEEPVLRKVWQDWASEYVQQFDYPRIVDQYEELYQEALKQYGERSEA